MSDQRGYGSRWNVPDRPTSKNYSYLRRLGHFLRPYIGALSCAGVALVITALATLTIGVGVKYLIDDGLGAGNMEFLNQGLYGLLTIIVVMSAGTYFRFYFISWVGERVVADIRAAVFNQVLKLSPGFFEVTRTGEVLSRLTTDTTLLQSVIGSSLSIALRSTLTLIGGIIMLIITNAKLTGLVALVVPLVILPIIWYGRKVRRLSRASQDRIADVGAYAEENLNAIRTVQAFCHEDIDKARFGEEVENAFLIAVKRIAARAVLGAIIIFLVFGAIAVILWAGSQDVIAGRISPGELSAFIVYAVMVATSTGSLTEVFSELQRAAGATERLIELLETEPAIAAPADAEPLPEPAQGRITLDNVTFHYPSRPLTPALNALNLEIVAGETVALVGPSGAGKTTVFQLLLRFYDPTDGNISFDGVNLRSTDPRDARAHMGLVAQDPVIFAADAMENIRYGRPEASDEEVCAAADAAQASEFINRLPGGMNSFLGEKGVRLSGGQKQRIAIARAILRDPALLLLDEATSALDAESERLVQKALEVLMEGRTTMVIAHRLATVVNADRIAVLDHGHLAATGTHESLLATNELYARLAALQFSAEASSAASQIAATG